MSSYYYFFISWLKCNVYLLISKVQSNRYYHLRSGFKMTVVYQWFLYVCFVQMSLEEADQKSPVLPKDLDLGGSVSSNFKVII